jgi:hypothetical protein
MSTAAISELENAKQELLKEIEALDISIRILKGKMPITAKPIEDVKPVRVPAPTPATHDFSKFTAVTANTNTYKVLQAIKGYGKFVKSGDIYLKLAEHKLKKDAIRSAITYLKKVNTIVPIQDTANNNDTVWGLKEWVVDGKIKEEYKYDPYLSI